MNKIFLLIGIFLQINAIAQNKIITGTIKDDKGTPIAAAIVTVKGKLTAVASKLNGNFEISVSDTVTTLNINAIGYQQLELKVAKKLYSNLNVVLKNKISTLDEVVVVGYSTAKRKAYSSSVTTVYTSEIRDVKKVSSDKVLAGKVSGLEITKDKSIIRIRGAASLSTTPNVPTKSKILTASEVNDFTKWTLWDAYNKSDFKDFSKQFAISYTNRIAVQLTTTTNQALVNTSILLKTKMKDSIIWQTKTDNTGKAELWNNTALKDYEIYVLIGNQKFDIHNFNAGINIINTNNFCNTNNAADIAFIVDATGSMQDEIDYLKDEISTIIGTVANTNQQTQLQFSSIFYRDYGDAYVTQFLPFTNNIKTLSDFISNQNAGGGGDYPEAVVSALQLGLDSLKWNENASARIAFLVLDAPPHDYEMGKYKNLMEQYAAKGIRVVPIVCSGAEKSVEFLMRSIALATNGTYTFLTDESGIGGKHLKPTTDNYNVQLLNQLMINIINKMIITTSCSATKKELKTENPFTINTINKNEVKIYPNPTRNISFLQTDEEIEYYFITDFNGKILEKVNAINSDSDIEINVTKYPSGTYIIQYFTKEKNKGSVKLIKL